MIAYPLLIECHPWRGHFISSSTIIGDGPSGLYEKDQTFATVRFDCSHGKDKVPLGTLKKKYFENYLGVRTSSPSESHHIKSLSQAMGGTRMTVNWHPSEVGPYNMGWEYGILSVISVHQLPNEMKLQLQPDWIICWHFPDKKAKSRTTLFWDALSLWGHPHHGTCPALQVEY